MRTERVTRPVTYDKTFVVFTFPKIEGFELPYDMVEELCEVDGFFSGVVVYPSSLRHRLERHGLIRTTARGASYGTERLHAIARKEGIIA